MHSVILYYVVQAAELHRRAQRDAPARAAIRARRTRAPRRGTAPAGSPPWRRSACSPCGAVAAHDRAAHRAHAPAPAGPSCPGRSDRPGVSARREAVILAAAMGPSLEVPVTSLPGLPRARHPTLSPARCPLGRQIRSVS